MEAFNIQCTTCRARLKVHEASAIGQILGCPKCGSMVQVVPPVGWKPEQAVVAAASVVAKTSTVANTATAAPKAPAPSTAPNAAQVKAPPPTAPAKTPATVTHAHVSALPVVLPAATSPASVVASPPPLATAGATAIAPPVHSEVAVRSTWAVLLARLQRDRVLLAGGFAAGVLVGVGIWLALVAMRGDNASPTVLASTQNTAEEPALQNDVPSLGNAAAAPTNAAATPDSDSTESTTVDEPASETVDGADESSEENESAEESTDGAAAESTEPQPAAAERAPAAQPQPAEPTLAAPAVVEGSSRQAEFEERLAEKLPSVSFQKVPLGQFIEFVAQLTSLPITLDAEALAAKGKGSQTPISVKLSQVTVARALDAALKPHGLAWSVRDDKLVITAKK